MRWFLSLSFLFLFYFCVSRRSHEKISSCILEASEWISRVNFFGNVWKIAIPLVPFSLCSLNRYFTPEMDFVRFIRFWTISPYYWICLCFWKETTEHNGLEANQSDNNEINFSSNGIWNLREIATNNISTNNTTHHMNEIVVDFLKWIEIAWKSILKCKQSKTHTHILQSRYFFVKPFFVSDSESTKSRRLWQQKERKKKFVKTVLVCQCVIRVRYVLNIISEWESGFR